ncbi:precorrin-2 C(20)-methyltransferase [Rugosimonospora africana]|uniref:Precorrin-2 C(20)-methyltransferase n=1 Tax=Rugosimonospora africana TaxID=556532 RepID=A0A8J3QP57_9ACTN|nr:precorrin-2 C(20)-methyltransferase [Rugosimonospora africana]GIH14835.1 precorrin-2 C(20)-methyltransferase [Rugosimonospora africana]
MRLSGERQSGTRPSGVRLIGVGVGPGDPELVTLKAARILGSADRVFVPVLDPAEAGRAEATVATHTPPERVERLVFALDRGQRDRYWAAAGERVAQWLSANGGTAAFATIGDPNLYSTFGYLARCVRDALPEVVVETVPGITAMQALASASGTVLAEGHESLTLLPLPDGADGVADALSRNGTVVVYKGGRHLPAIGAAVAASGRDAILGSHVGLPDERIAPLSTVDAAVPYLSTVLIPAKREGDR